MGALLSPGIATGLQAHNRAGQHRIELSLAALVSTNYGALICTVKICQKVLLET